MKLLTSFSQAILINNIQAFFDSRFPEATSKLNKRGICLAISLCYINQLFFNEDRGESFLTMLLELSKRSLPFIRNGKKIAATYLDDLYTEIETLKNSLQDPQTESGKIDELKALLGKKHEQLAFIENMFLFYAVDNGGDLKKLSLNPLLAPRASLAGLTRYTELNLHLSTKEQVARLFNQQDPLCPFTQGGIYEINTDNHSMVVWFDENKNELKLFDPNLGWLLMDKITLIELYSSLFFSYALPHYKKPNSPWNIDILAYKPIEHTANPPVFKVDITQERSVVEKFRSAYEAAAAENQKMIETYLKPELVIWAKDNNYIEILIDLIKNKEEESIDLDSLLSWAVEKGHLELTQTLIDAGADINISDIRRWVNPEIKALIVIAAEKGHVDIVNALLAKDVQIDVKNNKGNTPLFIAAEKGHVDIVNALLAKGAQIDIENNEGNTPLFIAIKNNQKEIENILLGMGGGFMEASILGHIERVQELIAVGANLYRQDKYGKTALSLAAANGRTEVVTALLAAGADLNLADKEGRTPLFWAIENDRKEIVTALLAAGANVNLANKYETTPLAWAAANGRTEVVTALLAAGADLNLADKEGRTPLFWAIENDCKEIVTALLAAGADLNLADKEGRTPLFWAIENDRKEIVTALLVAGANVNLANKYETTPLAWAAANGRTEVVTALLTAGADLNLADKEGRTPLFWAIENDRKEIVTALLAAGANVNHDRKPPLSCAAKNGHIEIVRALLAAGADINLADKEGRTPLFWVAQKDCTEIVRLLNEEISSQKH